MNIRRIFIIVLYVLRLWTCRTWHRCNFCFKNLRI